MAGSAFPVIDVAEVVDLSGGFSVIDVIDLIDVLGGVDKQTSKLQLVIAQMTSAMEDVARKVAPPKSNPLMEALPELLSRMKGSGPGPASAPATPPPHR